jgi:DNA-binding transcriptional regulator/RsmH inhibitor MraZ
LVLQNLAFGFKESIIKLWQKLLKKINKNWKGTPLAILPLKEWEKMREYIEELEEKKRYLKAFKEGKGKKG